MPHFAATVWQRWKAVAERIGQFQALLVFTVLYFVMVTPFALVLKLTDPLRIHGPAGWCPPPKQTATLADAHKQF